MLKVIGAYTFYNTSLKTIIIPKNVNDINNYAFAGISNLSTVYFKCNGIKTTNKSSLDTTAFNQSNNSNIVNGYYKPGTSGWINGSQFGNLRIIGPYTNE